MRAERSCPTCWPPAAPTEGAGYAGPSIIPTTCTCTPHPYGDGPERDCPVHGDVRLYAEWLAAALAERDALRDTVARIEALADSWKSSASRAYDALRAALAPPSPGEPDEPA